MTKNDLIYAYHCYMRAYQGYTLKDVLEEYSCQTFLMMEQINKENKEIERNSKKGNQKVLGDFIG